jgi:integrase/recombinase XerC
MLDKFKSYLRSVNTAENTIKAYVSDAGQFLEFLRSEGILIHNVTSGTLLGFLGHLTDCELKSSTRRRKMESVKTFFQAMKKLELIKDDPMKGYGKGSCDMMR